MNHQGTYNTPSTIKGVSWCTWFCKETVLQNGNYITIYIYIYTLLILQWKFQGLFFSLKIGSSPIVIWPDILCMQVAPLPFPRTGSKRKNHVPILALRGVHFLWYVDSIHKYTYIYIYIWSHIHTYGKLSNLQKEASYDHNNVKKFSLIMTFFSIRYTNPKVGEPFTWVFFLRQNCSADFLQGASSTKTSTLLQPLLTIVLLAKPYVETVMQSSKSCVFCMTAWVHGKF